MGHLSIYSLASSAIADEKGLINWNYGMPLANCTTAANGSEREQIISLLDRVRLKTLKKGRPKKRVKVLAAAQPIGLDRRTIVLRALSNNDEFQFFHDLFQPFDKNHAQLLTIYSIKLA